MLLFVFFLVIVVVADIPTAVFAVENLQVEICSFGQNLYAGVKSSEVRCLQRFLNTSGFPVASEGAGSPGRETDYYGPRTARAVPLWQRTMGVSPAQGFFGPRSRAAYRVLAQKAVPVSSPAVSGITSAPAISSVAPDHIADGDTVVISGNGFVTDGNLVRYSIDPPGFAGRNAASDSGGSLMSIRIDTAIRAKIRGQIAGLPVTAQSEIKIHLAKSISAQYGIAAAGGAAYVPIDLTVRNKNGTSAPFRIFINVIP